MRWLLFLGGWLSLGIGALGVILPVLPTTVFVLIAAGCFARSSPRFYHWLLANRVFGPLIHDWRQHRSIPLRAKIVAVAMIAIVGGATIAFAIDAWWLRIVLTLTLASVATWLVTRPTAHHH